MTAKKPSKGVIISGWILIVFGSLQLFFVPSAFREFSFLPAWAVWACVIYLSAYNFCMLYGGANALKLKHWARGLIIIVLILGIADKAFFTPLRFRALERVKTEPRLRGLLIREYRQSLPAAPPLSDEELIVRIVRDLRNVQKGVEGVWIVLLLSLLVFYSNPLVREQFRKSDL